MNNNERNIIRIINEICKEEQIDVKSYSYNWIFRLTKKGISKHIIGYKFELNYSSVATICGDKCAASDILISEGIPCVEHNYFISPTSFKYIAQEGNWKLMQEYLEKYEKVVCKPNDGTGGHNVILVNNEKELEHAVFQIFAEARGLALCPFYDIKNEYRIIVLNKEVKLIFLKQTPHIIGNGKDNILQLLANSEKHYKIDDFEETINYYYVPHNNEVFRLNWRHNLGLGATAQIVKDQKLISILSELALKAAGTLNIKFASVDIVEVDGQYKVLEINSGVMMNNFSAASEENYQIAKSIYKDAINLMFEIK